MFNISHFDELSIQLSLGILSANKDNSPVGGIITTQVSRHVQSTVPRFPEASLPCCRWQKRFLCLFWVVDIASAHYRTLDDNLANSPDWCQFVMVIYVNKPQNSC